MKAKKVYSKPQFKSVKVQLGVFGDYGSGGGTPGGDDSPGPVKVTNPFDFTIE